MNFKYILQTIKEFENDFETIQNHYEDLKYTSMCLYNLLVRSIRGKGESGYVRKVLEASKYIKDNALLAERLRIDLDNYTREFTRRYIIDGAKIPGYACFGNPTEEQKERKVGRFLRKKNIVKEYAIEAVTKMYRISQEHRNANTK